ncbi:MAG TPA: sigma 54-interacting transcriptional regulator, partial [Clostridia bacterium]|nr:sigma 54-interacting transcriptional regulator [Clostridia bacterium]
MEDAPKSAFDRRVDTNVASHLLLEMAQERSLDRLLEKLVNHVGQRPGVACFQVWLLETNPEMLDSRQTDQPRCLCMVSGIGTLLSGEKVKAPPFYDPQRRVPLGVGLLGRAVAEGRQIMIRDVKQDPESVAHIEWLEREQVRACGATPIQFQGQTLGVIVGFTREVVPEEAHIWGQIFADHIGAAIANARAFEEIELLRTKLELQNTYLQEEVVEAKAFGDLIGNSAALRQIISQIDLVAPTDASILILGETGTGKELVAHEIHRRSARKDKPLVRVNCASILRELYESEFFGHVKGAFTGAIKDRSGRFETAEGGTLFLDEVGEIPLELQGKLLRVLQEKRYERVGDDRTRLADVRIIGATNRDLKREVAAGRFREDLYYRLHVFPIHVATLKERLEDVPLLAQHFIDLSVKELRCTRPRLTRAAVAQLQGYSWPGNVRELRNVIQRAVILARGGPLQFDLPSAGSLSAPPP